MAHCPPELLDAIAGVLAEVQAWPGVIEKSSGVLYARRQPFLHFHLTRDGQRRADVRGQAGWASLVLPRPISATRRRDFLRLLRARYRDGAPPHGPRAPARHPVVGGPGKRATRAQRTAPTARAIPRRPRSGSRRPRRTGS